VVPVRAFVVVVVVVVVALDTKERRQAVFGCVHNTLSPV